MNRPAPNPKIVYRGEPASLTYTVSNPGDTVLTSVKVQDNNGGGGSYLAGPGKFDNLLAVSAECERGARSFPMVGGVQECLVHARIRAPLIRRMRSAIADSFGPDPAASPDYPRIVNQRHFDRLNRYLSQGTPAAGGVSDADSRYIRMHP